MDDLVQRLMAKAAKGGVIPIHDVTIEEAAAKIDRLRQLLRAVQTDAGNWLNTDLQYAIEVEVGKAGSYRDLADSGVPPPSANAPR